MILIESQWNLKGGYSNNDPDIVKNINRITVEFKGIQTIYRQDVSNHINRITVEFKAAFPTRYSLAAVAY